MTPEASTTNAISGSGRSANNNNQEPQQQQQESWSTRIKKMVLEAG